MAEGGEEAVAEVGLGEGFRDEGGCVVDNFICSGGHGGGGGGGETGFFFFLVLKEGEMGN